MKKSYLNAVLVCLFLGSASVLAQPRGDTKILLPLVVEESISGAYGSKWITRIAVLNHGPRPVVLDNYIVFECLILCDSFRLTPPGITFYPKFRVDNTSYEVEGYFLHTTREDLPWVDVKIHVQDISRQSLTWGTEIPAVPETEAFTAELPLIDIPIGPRFRSLLRVYDFDPDVRTKLGARIAYRIYGIRPLLQSPRDSATGNIPVPADTLIASGELSFRVQRFGPFGPSSTRLDVSSIPAVQGYERIRIELSPLTPGLRYWAFVAVTNNETQHVTTITP